VNAADATWRPRRGFQGSATWSRTYPGSASPFRYEKVAPFHRNRIQYNISLTDSLPANPDLYIFLLGREKKRKEKKRKEKKKE